ncbi:hypothetical protein ASF09_18605 [Sphingomonas sp. Leaf242]|nr:hypothetical protein ASF09_18605 [Sphingomonas sp. Leaf242]
MRLLIVAALLVAMLVTGWYIYTKMMESKRKHRFARKRARDALAWQKVLDKNAADRAMADAATGSA